MLCVNRRVALVFIVCIIFAFIYTTRYPAEVVNFPRFIFSLLLIFNIVLFIKPGDIGKIKVTKFLTPKKVITSIFMIAYVLLFPVLGFFVTTFIFVLSYILFFERTAKTKALLIASGWIVILYLVFQKVLYIWFPKGFFL